MDKQIKLHEVDANSMNGKEIERVRINALATYFACRGWNLSELSDDSSYADFVLTNDDYVLLIQLKGRISASKKYLNKGIYIMFPVYFDDDSYKIYAVSNDNIMYNFPRVKEGTQSVASYLDAQSKKAVWSQGKVTDKKQIEWLNKNSIIKPFSIDLNDIYDYMNIELNKN